MRKIRVYLQIFKDLALENRVGLGIILLALLMVLNLYLSGCAENPAGPDPEVALKPAGNEGPPDRPPLPCGWSVVDNAYVYDLHADTCNGR